ANAFYVFSKPWHNRKYVLNLNGFANYNRNISYIDSNRNIGKNFILNQSVRFDVTIKEWLELGVNGSYGINSNRYSLTTVPGNTTGSYVFGGGVRFYLPSSIILSYDAEKTINKGFAGVASANPFIMNGFIEKQLFKKKSGSIKLQAFDLLNQNVSVNRTVNANAISDTRTNRLGRYYMLTFSFRLSKFKGQQPQMQMPTRPPEGMRLPGM
ncbi:MAG: outer membrane beta-barrel protein, partial [Bacteroidia bacterium]|nr:outer membrane beta-barrel protein [Bacteroidia bacterium]